jgi:DNA-binding PadR family transcriptional regulator
MTIQYAILGLLSWRPLSGYDLKKIISESDLFYWSGNNNQIYNSLVALHRDGWVSQEVLPQDNLPARKEYSITEKGRAALRDWVRSAPELPELHANFLIQLAWAGELSDEELQALLADYEAEVEAQLKLQIEKSRRRVEAPDRSAREIYLWDRIYENLTEKYRLELEWVRQVRAGLKKLT